MKTKISYLLSLLAVCLFLAVGCKKSADGTPATDSAANLQVQADDQARVSGESDAVANDANLILNHPTINSQFSFNGPTGVDSNSFSGIICDATVVVDTVSNPHTITINYNGTTCDGIRSRTGVVILSMPAGMHWGNQNAVLTINIQNLKIKRLSDNKSITLNGTKVMTNVTGGRLIDLPNGTTIIHTITSSNMSITFDDGSQRSWQIAKRRSFTYNNGIVITVTGTHTDGTHEGIAEWGTNRFGKTFVTLTSQPIVIRQDCYFRIVSGQITTIRPDITTSATFGLDASGVATSCPGSGHYYLKLVWTGNAGKVYTFILPY